MGTRMKESDVLCHRSDTFHGKTKERKDKRVISHQTGKISASRAEAALTEIFHKIGEVQDREEKAMGCSSRTPHGLSLKNRR